MKRGSSLTRPWSSSCGPSRLSLRADTLAKTCCTVSPNGGTVCSTRILAAVANAPGTATKFRSCWEWGMMSAVKPLLLISNLSNAQTCDQLTWLRIDQRRVRCTVAWAVADVASPATAFAWTGLICMWVAFEHRAASTCLPTPNTPRQWQKCRRAYQQSCETLVACNETAPPSVYSCLD